MTISRVTIPEEFSDRTSAMMLRAPEPQYLHGSLFKSALRIALMGPAAMGLQLPGRQITGGGADPANINANRLLLSDPLFSAAITVADEFGKGVGHTVRINRPKFIDSTYDEDSRTVKTGQVISTVPIDIQSEQTSLTIKQFAGPFGAAAHQPYAIDKVDAKRSAHNLVKYTGMHLVRDLDKFCDYVTVKLFDRCGVVNTVFADGMTGVNDSVLANDCPMSCSLLYKAEQLLTEQGIPRFADGTYAVVLTALGARELKQDPEWKDLSKFHRDINPLIAGSYMGHLGNLRVFQSTTLTVTNNSNSIPIHSAQMFGPGMVGLGLGEEGEPQVAFSSDDNYGQQAKVIWLMEAAMANLDARFGTLMKHS